MQYQPITTDYLFSQTFQLSISSSTNKVAHFNIIRLLFIWIFHTEDRGGHGRLHRHIKKEEEKEIT